MNNSNIIGHPINLKGRGDCGVRKDCVKPTLQAFAGDVGLDFNDFHIIGSTGKVEWSGDIDIAVDARKYDPIEVHNEISDVVGQFNCMLNLGTRVGSYAYSIRGDGAYPKIKIDIMYVNNTTLAEFTFFSPSEGDSMYKGAIRTILLQAVASALNVKAVDFFQHDDHGLLVRCGRTLDLPVGLRRIYQHRPMRKDGKGRTKTLKTLTKSEFNNLYPDINVQDIDDVIDDPRVIVQVLFGSDITEDDVSTAEHILYLIHDDKRFDDEQRNTILSIAKTRVKPLKDKMAIPPILESSTITQ